MTCPTYLLLREKISKYNSDKFNIIRSALLTSEEAIDYTHLLNECLKSDQLLDAKTMTNIQHRLDARNALGQSASQAKNPVIELGQYDMEEMLRLRFAPRTELSATIIPKNSDGRPMTAVTVRLNKRKIFQSPLQPSFSVGRHPVIIPLKDYYYETFFFRRADNSLFLSSTTGIDVYNRGTGLKLHVPLHQIICTRKDKILAGTWCERYQRLILNGNRTMYFFHMPKQQHADQFSCDPIHGDIHNTLRFLGCTHDAWIFYGKLFYV